MCVTRRWDDLRLEVICLTSLEIAGSPRNISWYSGTFNNIGGRALDGPGDVSCRYQSNSEYQLFLRPSQSCRAKLMWREGNIPDSRLRSLNII